MPEHPPEKRLCALVSKCAGEDPIGTAFHRWARLILMEVPLPWPYDLLQSPHVPTVVRDTAKSAKERGIRVLAIAPDEEFSHAGVTRLIVIDRPTPPFAVFDRREYLVPAEALSTTLQALLSGQDGAGDYRVSANGVRDLLVCTHGAVDACCGKLGYPLYETLRERYMPALNGSLRVWRTSHFGGHRFAPTMVDVPTGQWWGHLDDSAVLDDLINRTGSTAALGRHYRGWCGFDFFAQIAERELFARMGWRWLSYRKSAQIVAIDPDGEDTAYPHLAAQPPRWAEVRIEYDTRNGTERGAYDVRLEWAGTVGSIQCSEPDKRRPISQYEVVQVHSASRAY